MVALRSSTDDCDPSASLNALAPLPLRKVLAVHAGAAGKQPHPSLQTRAYAPLALCRGQSIAAATGANNSTPNSHAAAAARFGASTGVVNPIR